MTLAIAVHLVEHDPRWAERAQSLMAMLAPLNPPLLRLYHVGSTAIPGILAKPVIDIVGVASSMAALDAAEGRVRALGLGWHGEFGVDGRRFCTLDAPIAGGKDGEVERIANFHFYAAGSRHIKLQVAFRDYLRAHADVAADYAAEKRRIRALHPNDSVAYSAEKGPFIRAVLDKALAWHPADEL
ncbi:MAG: GrpB family protein [Sphingomonadaceae bacterium]|nr:GrpB family protein [Sphingomonadaceae bacterium]